MRKSKEPLGFFTFKLTDHEYAQLATQSAALGLSMGAMLRAMVHRLPDVDASVVMRWAALRKRSGHERASMSLGEIERRLSEPSALEPGARDDERLFLEVKKDEMLKEAAASMHELDTRSAFDILNRAPSRHPSAIEIAELETLAEESEDWLERERAQRELAEIAKRKGMKEL